VATPRASSVQGATPQFAKGLLRLKVDADTVYMRTLRIALSSLWEGARDKAGFAASLGHTALWSGPSQGSGN
jgi:hypothetical protein